MQSSWQKAQKTAKSEVLTLPWQCWKSKIHSARKSKHWRVSVEVLFSMTFLLFSHVVWESNIHVYKHNNMCTFYTNGTNVLPLRKAQPCLFEFVCLVLVFFACTVCVTRITWKPFVQTARWCIYQIQKNFFWRGIPQNWNPHIVVRQCKVLSPWKESMVSCSNSYLYGIAHQQLPYISWYL